MIQFLVNFPEYQDLCLEDLPYNERKECAFKMLAFSVDAAKAKVFDLEFLWVAAELGRNLDPMDAYVLKMLWSASHQWCFNLFAHDATARGSLVQQVYFAGRGNTVKIGISVDPKARIKSLQVSSPHPIVLLATQDGGRKVEQELHQQFKDDHILGEWFNLSQPVKHHIDSLQDPARRLR